MWKREIIGEYESNDGQQKSNGIEDLAWSDFLDATLDDGYRITQGLLQLTSVMLLANCYNKSSAHNGNVIGLCSVLRPLQHSIGYMGDGFYRSKDPTNNIKVLKEARKENNTKNKENTKLTCIDTQK